MIFVDTLVLVLATILMGLIAGLFYGFSCGVMPGLRRTSDRVFIGVMQRINVAILNGWFGFGFVGALLSTILAVVFAAMAGDGEELVLTSAALVLYVSAIGVTRGVNIPLNTELEGVGEPESVVDPAEARRRFEAVWVRWNHVRAVLVTAALGCLCWALLSH